MVKFASQQRFDAAYYRRFYLDPRTRAASPQDVQRRCQLIIAILRRIDLPIRRVLDVGCGLGWYERPILKAFGAATYTGVEFSEHLCRKYGWLHGSIADLELRGRFDLVICADVAQYLETTATRRAIRNLARLCRGALYFQTPTRLDWRDNVDVEVSDAQMYLRSGEWYRRELRRYFVHVGFGLHVRKGIAIAQFELEEPWR